MDNVRREFIIELLNTLKVPSGAFNVGTVSDEIQHIPDISLRAFYKALFGTDHSYLNGMDRIIKVAEQFKPQQVDLTEIKAKELIGIVESINTKIGNDAERMGEDFVKLVMGVKLRGLGDDDIAILNSVKPHTNHKLLIINIRGYQTSLDCLNAFKRAIEYSNSYCGSDAISHTVMKSLEGNR